MLVLASLLFALIGYSLYSILSLWLLILTLAALIFIGSLLIFVFNKRNIDRTGTNMVSEEIEPQLETKGEIEQDKDNPGSLEMSSPVEELKEEREIPIHKQDNEDFQLDEGTVNINNENPLLDEDKEEKKPSIDEMPIEECSQHPEFVEVEESELVNASQEDSYEIKGVEHSKEVNPIDLNDELIAEGIEADQKDQISSESTIIEAEIAVSEDTQEVNQELQEIDTLNDQALIDMQESSVESSVDTCLRVDLSDQESDVFQSEDTEETLVESTDIIELENEQQEIIEETTLSTEVEVKPIDKQVLQLLLDQLDAYKPILSQVDYESLLIQHINTPMHHQDYYIFTSRLRDFYIETSEWKKLNDLLTQLLEDFKDYPIIIQEIQFVSEQYMNNNKI